MSQHPKNRSVHQRTHDSATDVLAEAIRQGGTTESLEARQILFAEGQNDGRVFLVESGSIDIGLSSSEGQRLTLNVLGPGDVFGEIAMLDGGPRTADAVARVESRVRSLDRGQFFALFSSEIEAYEYVVKLLCQRLRWTNRYTEHSLLTSARVRLASRLLMLDNGHEQDWIRANQQELADMSGIVREYVNRLLKEWEGQGIVNCERGAVRILQRNTLVELAQSEA